MNLKKTTIGGQALIEGIMMRGPEKIAIASLKKDKSISVEIKDTPMPSKKHKILGFPFIRGVVNMASSLIIGMKALTDSANNLELEEEEEPSKFDKWLDSKFDAKTLERLTIGLGVFFGILLPVILYIVIPAFLTSFLRPYIGSSILLNLIEGVIKISIFVLFLYSTSRMKEMKRVYSFHGAEHKSIFAYEKGLPLTVDNIKIQSRFHPRCGTSFLFVVLIIGILIYSLISWENMFLRIAIRIVCLPLLVSVTYEINRYVGRYDNFCTIALRAPGLLMQRFTTNEPDDDMIKTAIAALEPVIPPDESDKW